MSDSKKPAQKLVEKLREDVNRVLEDARKLELNPRSRSVLSGELQRSAAALNALLADIDPIERPTAIFDPGNPRTVGFFVALALTAQTKKPLASLTSFYGGGIYALYYSGSYAAYKAIAGSETPIYVGMALYGASSKQKALTLGTPLAGRLTEHRKNIERAKETLSLDDFSYRALVVQSGWEAPAEDYLIRMFRPLWNRETNILYGFGKHGDSSETRKNKRSPWDTLHSGRKWAIGEHQVDAKTSDEIIKAVESHFSNTKVFKKFQDVLNDFVSHLQQVE
ncbi:MAG TPA: Eco29kI family restriction endonuclease [Acidobacteriaceae bacterium]|jgi:hypothetical protein